MVAGESRYATMALVEPVKEKKKNKLRSRFLSTQCSSLDHGPSTGSAGGAAGRSLSASQLTRCELTRSIFLSFFLSFLFCWLKPINALRGRRAELRQVVPVRVEYGKCSSGAPGARIVCATSASRRMAPRRRLRRADRGFLSARRRTSPLTR